MSQSIPLPGTTPAPSSARPPDVATHELSLVLRQVSRGFGERVLFTGLDLACNGPCVVGIAGRNGSGKSSLLRIIAQLLEPTTGEIEVCGARVCGDDPTARALVALVAHEPAVRRSRSVRDNITFELQLRGRRRAEARARAAAMLARWELREQATRPVEQLSRGQLQRLALALADATGAAIVLLDEPTVALDSAGRELLEGAIDEWRSRRIVVIASHEIAWLEQRSDVVIELEESP